VALFKKKLKDPVEGTALISACDMTTGTSGVGGSSCHMSLVLQAPGVPAMAVEHNAWYVSSRKWPSPGMTVPVLLDRGNPKNFKILWDKVDTVKERTASQADMLAEALRARQASSQVVMPAPGDEPTSTDDRIRQLERLAQLHASGALSQEEFEAEKHRLLGE
jgi:hypothetical protein